ncbi:unnamed protein product [Orchesella dallaii]|uniref:Uncharacterized protein n=1 Tax=Orchesella dallaii TaxID=48710 RepID=A0ABP1QG44_9HEXA
MDYGPKENRGKQDGWKKDMAFNESYPMSVLKNHTNTQDPLTDIECNVTNKKQSGSSTLAGSSTPATYYCLIQHDFFRTLYFLLVGEP